MALNDPRNHKRFQLWNTWDIQQTETAQHMAEWVTSVARGAPGGKLKHLVLNCHGSPGYLQLGQGVQSSTLSLFSCWRGLIEKIWIPACQIAFIPPAGSGQSDGNVFCSNFAKTVGCYVVASTETQCSSSGNIQPDMMPSFEGLILSYGPSGNITWQARNPSTYNGFFGGCVAVPD
jgi:hypothetical protein